MTRLVIVVAVNVALLSGQLAFAAEFEDCMAACKKAHADCIGQLSESNGNDVYVQSAKQACGEELSRCKKQCHYDLEGAPQDPEQTGNQEQQQEKQ